jgi:hypothetical protein
MMRRFGMVGAASGLLFAAAFGFAATGALAAPLSPDVGWWWVGRTGGPVPLQLDPAPAVPEGGLYVAADPSGPSAVSAVRIRLEPDAADPVLTLDVSDTIGTPALDACVATAAWTPADGGVWDQRPPSDCSRKVAGAVSADGSKVSFALASLVDDATIDVVLVPAAPAEDTPAAAFSTAFEPLKAESVSTAPPWTYEPPPPDDPPGPALEPSYTPSYDTGVGFSTALQPELQPLPAVASPPAATPRPGSSPTPIAEVALSSAEGFQYAAILALPLLLVVACSYVGWALTRPIDVRRAGVRDGRS